MWSAWLVRTLQRRDAADYDARRDARVRAYAGIVEERPSQPQHEETEETEASVADEELVC